MGTTLDGNGGFTVVQLARYIKSTIVCAIVLSGTLHCPFFHRPANEYPVHCSWRWLISPLKVYIIILEG